MAGGAHIPHGHGSHEHEKTIGLFIAVLAVIMAVVSALAKDAANNRLSAEIRSSNQFSWYQAKRIRVHLNELTLKELDRELLGSPTAAQRESIQQLQASLRQKNSEYEVENRDILAEAEQLKQAAAAAGHQYHAYENAEIFLQIAVVLCSVTLLTGRSGFLIGGVVLTVIGVILAAKSYFGDHSPPTPKPATPAAQPASASPNRPAP